MLHRIWQNLRLARELGLEQTLAYGQYQLGLRLGLTRRALSAALNYPLSNASVQPCWTLPSPVHLSVVAENTEVVESAADAIVAGQIDLFGFEQTPLNLTPPAPLLPALTYGSRVAGQDIKFIWEPARFGWVFTLARAALLTDCLAYAEAFWQYFEQFSRANPPYLGPNWASAQEAALRLGALAFAAQVFENSPASTPERLAALREALVLHARRIPPTLSYARAQNNNHLLTEALSLLLAAAALPDLPEASHWQQTGWRWLCHGLLHQIAPDGTYAQHSTNYHRLMLSVALWAQVALRPLDLTWPGPVRERLAAATRWLLAQLDLDSGQVPNLGHNDGANILPLSSGGYQDYRPVAQASARTFLGQPCLPPGTWDELSLWLGLLPSQSEVERIPLPLELPAVLRLNNEQGWASLRAVCFTSRPAHADQLHVDIWHSGQNITLDAGTYQYNADPPWDNALAGSFIHNTLTVAGRDQMKRVGLFRWSNWAQAAAHRLSPTCLEASHNGYAALGLRHRRQLRSLPGDIWEIEDWVEPLSLDRAGEYQIQLHWLLPDGDLDLSDGQIQIQLPDKTIHLSITADTPLKIQIVRAGEVVIGDPPGHPLRGWVSWHYAEKRPALSVVALTQAAPPIRLLSCFRISCSH